MFYVRQITVMRHMKSFYSTYNVTKECGISTRQLYYWELIGMVHPHYETFGSRNFRRYTADDIYLLKKAKHMLDEGFTLQAIKEKITQPAHEFKGENGL